MALEQVGKMKMADLLLSHAVWQLQLFHRTHASIAEAVFLLSLLPHRAIAAVATVPTGPCLAACDLSHTEQRCRYASNRDSVHVCVRTHVSLQV